MRRRSHVATAAFAFALAACKPDAKDRPPRVELRSFDPVPSSVFTAAPKPVFSALACDGRNVYAVSEGGVVLTERIGSGKDPALDALPDKPSLAAVTAGRASLVGVGARGVIVRRENDDSKWKPETSPVTTDLHGVVETRDWTVAVGAAGTIVARRSTGATATWTRIASPTQEDLFAVSRCVEENASTKICAVGGRGTLLIGDVTESGVVFRSIATGTERALRAVMSGCTHAVGDQGTIVQVDTDGARVVPSGTTEDLLAVAESEVERSKLEGSFGAVVAVGKRGAVVVRASGRNKIAPFKQVPVPTTDDLLAIVANGSFGFFVAPRPGGLYTLRLGVDAKHPFPPE